MKELILAVARSDANFDGRDFDSLGKADKKRYLERAEAGLTAIQISKILPESDWADTDDELTPLIKERHPVKTKRYDLYTKAMELIRTRHSKGALVMLVHYLLEREEIARAEGNSDD